MPPILIVFASVMLAALIVYYSIPTIITVARLKHLYDEPNERRVNTTVVPTLGGVAIFIGISLAASLASYGSNFKELQYILIAMVIMLFIGLKDDILNISPTKKLIAQLIAAGILVFFGDIRFTSLHGVFGIYDINYVSSVLITCFLVIVLINSLNLIDGIDGLASGVGIITCGTFGLWFFMAGYMTYAVLSFAVVGALLSFFAYNVFGTRNKIFMGDTGSLILGLVTAVLLVKFNELNIIKNNLYWVDSAPAVSFSIMIVPLIDTIRVFTIRVLNKRSPFSADKNHTHHKLLELGLSHLNATLLIVSINTFFIAAGFLMQDFGNYVLLTFNLVGGVLVACYPSFLIKLKNNLQATKNDSLLEVDVKTGKLRSRQTITLRAFIQTMNFSDEREEDLSRLKSKGKKKEDVAV
ncbi:undecaprenyl/decaprenyl-phosphate alpha-N-acetylglucosaminyl 1-phosphate transferase [Puteibacter caeruleilacunae]|nr:undecaprenyl/decaprenyl-phosphate alpha-N-acetylglucosaminyl 1-phosphate transferase [Puteibacter caeruleilacunae]